MGVLAGLVASVVTFLVSLLAGGLGIYVGARVVAGVDDFQRAVWTALLGALVWGLVSLLVGWIPLLGGVLATTVGFVAYLWIVNARYPGGWIEAAAIALVAWVAAEVVLTLLGPLVRVEALGVPGV